ncbi:MAG TPA: diaminopimelate decarboxylase, partial [Ferruginibacter sp.]|nr:diaminopimelate decarboxylase [Ferruginibacter sp.]
MPLTQQQLLGIATEYGTPVYIYDAGHITAQYQRLRNAFAKTDTRFFYACKALTNIHILRHIKNIGCDVDCSSINEVKLALH